MPRDGALATALPTTKTDREGRFQIGMLPWWGRYTVYASDIEAGYSVFATRFQDSETIQEVTIIQEHPEAEFNFRLPPPAGFLHVHLTNDKTGEAIPGIFYKICPAERPDQYLISGSSGSARPILVPPDKDLRLHIESEGFKEWDQSIGKGVPIRIASGTHVTLEVRLQPSQ